MSNDDSLERVVGAVLGQHGQILRCHRRRDRASWPDVWDLPGGHIANEELAEEAIVGELEEELGVRVEPPNGPPWMTLRLGTVELSLYLIDRWQSEPRNVALEEHDAIGWFGAGDLEPLTWPIPHISTFFVEPLLQTDNGPKPKKCRSRSRA